MYQSGHSELKDIIGLLLIAARCLRSIIVIQIELIQRASEIDPKMVLGKSRNKLFLFLVEGAEESTDCSAHI
ncbi:hypothetical protein WL30_31430 [Burkholderia ubonensis]|nr:hypothetical protein WL30_31430 [Burkholderia ubonensis]KWB11983.1 hypothetical protein WL31_19930 [Burkholderia ubonensis]